MNRGTGSAIEREIERSTHLVKANNDLSTLLLALGGVVGLVQMGTHTVPFGRGFEMVALAQNLAEHGTYANPFGFLATGPTAANPPLYPFLLSIGFRLLHSTALVAVAATLVNIIANAITATLLPHISMLFYGNRRAGVVAAILWILACPLLPSWDVALTALTLLVFCLFTSATIATPRWRSSGIVAGLLASALFLFNPSTLLIFSPWLLWLVFRNRETFRQAAKYCFIALAVLVAAGSAWGIRNQRQLGGFTIRTNLGMTLYASNNDCARPSMKESELSYCYEAHHPNTSVEEAQLLSSVGEIAYDHMRTADAKAWISTHRSAFLHLTLARVRDFWFPVPWDSLFQSIVIWLATVLSVPGYLLMVRGRDRAVAFMVAALVIYPLMYYIVVSDVRYRLPVLWLSLLPAGRFLVWVWDRRRHSSPVAA